jgi:hypothetical protein
MEATKDGKQAQVTLNKLYGVVHGGAVECPLLPQPLVVTLKPSIRLIEKLGELPAGTKVGIENMPPELRREYDAKLISNGLQPNTHDQRYWDVIIKALHEKGHETVYLDEISQYDNLIRLQKEMKRVLTILQSRLLPRKEGRRLTAEQYALDVEIQNDLAFRRHDRLLQKICEVKPNVAVIGDGHANIMWRNQMAGHPSAIRIMGYSAETFADLARAIRSLQFGLSEAKSKSDLENWMSDHVDPNGFVENPAECQPISSESERRRYKAITKGRITDGVPTYIGTWDDYVPQRGLFEVFVEKRRANGSLEEISGTIEDSFGSSTFSGVLSASRINFVKRYSEEAIKAGGYKDEIVYIGSILNGRVSGQFNFRSGYSSSFEMSAFEPNSRLYAMKRG